MARFPGTIIHRTRDDQGPIEVMEDGAIRSLHFGTAARQSAMSLYEPEYLLLSYTRAMMAALLFGEPPRRALLVGLGGGSLAKFLLHHFPRCRIEVVELRHAVVSAARDHFQLPESDNLEIILGDGGEYLDQADAESYDLVLIDAYDETGMDPNLGEHDALRAARRILRSDGVLSINAWKAERALFGALKQRLDPLFDGRVLTLPVEDKGNVILLGLGAGVGIRGLGTLKRRAAELDRRLKIGLPQQLTALRKGNGVIRLGRALLL